MFACILREPNWLFTQVSECIKLLQTDSNLPIKRARMRIKVTVPVIDGQSLREKILEGAEKIEAEETGQENWEVVSLTVLEPFITLTAFS